MGFRTFLIVIQVLLTFATASPSAFTTPSPTYPNGTANPFYPCGTNAKQVAACPYRCYTSSGALEPQCYSEADARTAINSLQKICVQCTVPDQPEDYPGGCDPLSTYFDTASGFSSVPSPCGFKNHRLRSCAWICGEAQVPFSVCSTTNTTGPFSLCSRCMPQCSSPRIVFQPPFLPSNFSIATGSCSTQYGPQETVACPWRCDFAGRNGNLFCSLNNKTDILNGFGSCSKC